jgi:hypothetical protein
MPMRYSVIITTIYLPKILEALAQNVEKYGRKDEVEILIIGDLKTPNGVTDYVAEFKKRGLHFEYWDVKAQTDWLQPFPEMAASIPYNSDNRRNIGYLIAYQRGRECLIALDDDNYPTEEDYIGGHEGIGGIQRCKTVRTESGWFNVCDLLEVKEGIPIYPRGYPYACRWKGDDHIEYFESDGRVVVNAGLWLGDPDVDAVTRLSCPIHSIALKEKRVMLDTSTNCPFNTQNTAFHRDVLPSYYYVVMGQVLDGLRIDRYGDIWSSYFSRKVIDKMDDRVTFGRPLTRHDRHPHDLLKDLGEEYSGMVLTNRLVSLLADIDLTKTSYPDNYVQLSHKLEDKVNEQEDVSKDVKRYFSLVCRNMRTWIDVCRELDG